MMKCDQCGKNDATVKIMIQGKDGQDEGLLNLCQSCFNEFAEEHPDIKPAADFGAMMQAFFNMFNGKASNDDINSNENDLNIDIENVRDKLMNLIGNNAVENNDPKSIENKNSLGSNIGAKKFNSKKWKKSLNRICPTCKTSSKRFMTTGRLGCEKCYLAFKDEINEKLLAMTGENIVTKFDKTSISDESKVYILKRDLDEAVEREDYELAAKIRDDLKVLVRE